MPQIHIKDIQALERAKNSMNSAARGLDSVIGSLQAAAQGLKANFLDSNGRRLTADLEQSLTRLRKAQHSLERENLPELAKTIDRARRLQG